jgi:putative ABC transport system permease protein
MRDWKAEVRRRLIERRVDPTLHTSVLEELSQHLDDRYRSLLAGGLDEATADASVLRELDDDEALRSAARTNDALTRELRLLEQRHSPAAVPGRPAPLTVAATWARDFRYAARGLRRSPAFTAIAVLTLALGVGVNTAIFSVVNAVMLRPLPFGSPERLVRLYESNPERNWPEFSVSDPNFLDWRGQATSWDALAATTGSSSSLTWDSGAEVVRSIRVTPEFLGVLGIVPALGRDFRSDEARPAQPSQTAILNDGLWRRLFGADPSALGRVIPINGAPHTIVGILPPGFEWGNNLELLLPFAPDPARSRGDHQLTVIGRLKAGVSLDSATAELKGIAADLARQYPVDNEGWSVRLRSFYDWLVPEATRQSLVVLQGAVALVLLIACVNVANLLLARGVARQKELAIRVAVGASRGRILWHGALESLVLAAVSTAAGVALAAVTLRALTIYAADTVPRIDDASIDLRVLAFAALSSLVAALLFGVLPSMHAARVHGGQVLHDSSRGSTGGRARQRLRATLTVAEVALSVALLIGAGLLLRSFLTLQRVDPGFEVNAVMTGRVMLADREAFDTSAKRADFWRRMNTAIAALPGITAVSTGSSVPLGGGSASTEITVPGAEVTPGVQPSAEWRVAMPGYFKAMGIPLRGREFTEADGIGAPAMLIVSEALARTYWPGEDAVGKTITPRSLGNRPHTIVGVAGDLRSFGLDRDVRPTIYYSGLAAPVFNPMYLVWRSAVDPASLVPAIREAIRGVHPKAALYDVAAASDLLDNSFGPRRLNLYLLGLFATVALVLAAIGLFGVMAYLVSQRTREIGVRLALGAQRREVLQLIVGHGVSLALAGAVLGVVVALWLTRLMSSLLFSVSATDPVTFISVPLVLVVVALIACYVPARRAMRVDPMTALRSE